MNIILVIPLRAPAYAALFANMTHVVAFLVSMIRPARVC